LIHQPWYSAFGWLLSKPNAMMNEAPEPLAQSEPGRPKSRRQALSAREQEILDWVAQGLSNKEIGSRLGLSTFTVKNHLARIFEKLQVRSRTEAAMARVHSKPKRTAPAKTAGRAR
jgi:two-component system, NarL family, nitrate/nitrite response regulator NarL